MIIDDEAKPMQYTVLLPQIFVFVREHPFLCLVAWSYVWLRRDQFSCCPKLLTLCFLSVCEHLQAQKPLAVVRHDQITHVLFLCANAQEGFLVAWICMQLAVFCMHFNVFWTCSAVLCYDLRAFCNVLCAFYCVFSDLHVFCTVLRPSHRVLQRRMHFEVSSSVLHYSGRCNSGLSTLYFLRKYFNSSEEALKEIMSLKMRRLDLWKTIDTLYGPVHLECTSEVNVKQILSKT